MDLRFFLRGQLLSANSYNTTIRNGILQTSSVTQICYNLFNKIKSRDSYTQNSSSWKLLLQFESVALIKRNKRIQCLLLRRWIIYKLLNKISGLPFIKYTFKIFVTWISVKEEFNWNNSIYWNEIFFLSF